MVGCGDEYPSKVGLLESRLCKVVMGWERKLNIQSELLRGSNGANEEKLYSEPALPQPKAPPGPQLAHLHLTDNASRCFHYTGWECRGTGTLEPPVGLEGETSGA